MQFDESGHTCRSQRLSRKEMDSLGISGLMLLEASMSRTGPFWPEQARSGQSFLRGRPQEWIWQRKHRAACIKAARTMNDIEVMIWLTKTEPKAKAKKR